MPTYIVLACFTDKGVDEVKDTIRRSDKFKDMAKKVGVTVKDMYWTLGPIDVVAICEAPDDETATTLSMSVASRGYVRTQTLRAFNSEEVNKILDRLL